MKEMKEMEEMKEMKKLKLFTLLLSSLFVFTFFSAAAEAAKEIGVVNLNKVIENYSKAQEITANFKIKESELQQFVLNAQKKIKEAKTPLEKKNLEENLGEQFNLKRNAYAKEQSEKWQMIEADILNKTKALSKQKKFEMILNKSGVIVGGVDITDELIKKLNQDAKKVKK